MMTKQCQDSPLTLTGYMGMIWFICVALWKVRGHEGRLAVKVSRY
jgi:hypothetical protein